MSNMLRTSEVLERVPVSEDTLKRWRRRTRREKRQIGPPFIVTETGIVLYDEEQLEQWIKDRTVVA